MLTCGIYADVQWISDHRDVRCIAKPESKIEDVKIGAKVEKKDKQANIINSRKIK